MGFVISGHNEVIENKTYIGNLGARQPHPDGRPYHTFRTATVLVEGDHLTFRRCLFANEAGPGDVAGQAIALYVDGDENVFEDCIIEGNQDSLFLAPLPPKEYEKDGFLGPKQFTPRTPRHVIFRRCIIKGSIDFIFGGAFAEFEDCTFESVGKGYVFAPCTPGGQEKGFEVRSCKFTAREVSDRSCYIARPWREYAKVSLENCYLDRHINAEGWNDWGKKDAHETVRFREKGSFGSGASDATRPGYIDVSG